MERVGRKGRGEANVARSRCRRETGSWKTKRWRWRGRLINFFAFFDPHKLCRYTKDGEGSPRASGGPFWRATDGRNDVREGRVRLALHVQRTKKEKRFTSSLGIADSLASSRDHATFLTSLSAATVRAGLTRGKARVYSSWFVRDNPRWGFLRQKAPRAVRANRLIMIPRVYRLLRVSANERCVRLYSSTTTTSNMLF